MGKGNKKDVQSLGEGKLLNSAKKEMKVARTIVTKPYGINSKMF
jgi:hypothetical protein